MIWFVFGALLLILLLLVATPLLRDEAVETPYAATALNEARTQLAQLEREITAGRMSTEMAVEAREALEQRVLDLLKADPEAAPVAGPNIRFTRLAVPVILCFGALGLYAMLGSPDFGREPAELRTDLGPNALEGQSLESLVETLQQRLQADPDAPAVGYVLLARSLMSLQRYDDALTAYETAASRPDAVTEIGEELAQARAFIEAGGVNGMPMLDRDTVAATEAMSDEDRAAMIEGMVEGLARRLEAEPGDVEGWVRLIRARMVLGQTEQATLDLNAGLEGSAGDPEAQAYLRNVAADLGLAAPN